MPGKKNTSKPRGAMAEAANDKNERAIQAVLGGGEAHFARVEKNLGSYFKLIYHDGTALHLDIQGEPRGIFSARGKVRVKISAGDIVLLEGVQRLPEAKARGKTLIVEIIGRLSKKEAQHLYRAKRIHKQIYGSSGDEGGILDDLFDYGGEDEDVADSEEDEVEIQANIKRGKVIRARKMVSTAEKSTGRGSGGIQGRGGGGGRTVNAVREALDAAAYGRAEAAGAGEEDEEIDLDAMAEGLGASAPRPKKIAPEAATEPAAAASALPKETEIWEEETPALNLKSYENWEDAADELDIDAI